MTNKNIINKFKFPAGKYYIGDPCYALEESKYEKIIEKFETEAPFKIDDHIIFVHNTHYGDGSYEDQRGRSYCVDSGLIGIIPVNLISMKMYKNTQVNEPYAHLIDFKEEFSVYYNNGCFTFGSIEIETSPNDDGEDQNDWG